MCIRDSLPGAPSIYYGTEAGLSGGEEPACREAFPWRDPPADLSAFIGSLAQLRRAHPALRSAELELEPLGEDGLLLIRGSGSAQRRLVLNRSRDTALALPDGGRLGPQDWRLLA